MSLTELTLASYTTQYYQLLLAIQSEHVATEHVTSSVTGKGSSESEMKVKVHEVKGSVQYTTRSSSLPWLCRVPCFAVLVV